MSCTVGKCCCCVSLRAGTIAFGCLWLLVDSLFLAWSSYATYGLDTAVQRLIEEGFWDVEPQDRNASDLILIGLFWLSVVIVALYSLAVPMDIVLLVGAINRRPRLLHGWVAAYAVLYAFFMLACVPNAAVAFYYDPYRALVPTAVLLVHAGLTIYFWLVVRSYYLELGQQYGEVEARSTAGKVYRTVPTGDFPPAQGASCEGGIAMQAAAPPRYTSCA